MSYVQGIRGTPALTFVLHLLAIKIAWTFSPGMSKAMILHKPASLRAQLGQSTAPLPRLSPNHLQELSSKGFVIIENFIPESLQELLRQDVRNLRENGRFNVAKIGQDSTNTLNTNIRVAETCFIGRNRLDDFLDDSRSQLYDVLDLIRQDLPQPLDVKLSEFLYAYYPSGGFYRRHRDAIPGSASMLRKYSLLMYLNRDWSDKDGGKLRLHMDSGGDELPYAEQPSFIDVAPKGGTLVLFHSDEVPHEVLDTEAERFAIVGWYNRPLTASDISELSGGELNSIKLGALAVAAGLVTVGLINILGS